MEEYLKEFLLGLNTFNKRQYQEAIFHFERSLQIANSIGLNSPEEIFACYFNIGNAKRKLKKFPEAVSAYQNALKYNSQNEDVYLNITDCCFEIETVDSLELAVKLLSFCERNFPTNKILIANLGVGCLKLGIAYIETGKIDLAKKLFLNAKRLGSEKADELLDFVKDFE